MKRLAIALALAALGCLPAAARAELPYSYVQVRGGWTDARDVGFDGPSFDTEGSYALTARYHAFAHYRQAWLDGLAPGVGQAHRDTRTLRIGAGLRTPMSEWVDFVLRAALVEDYSSLPGGAGSTTGYGVAPAVRIAFTDRTEVSAGFDLDYVEGWRDIARMDAAVQLGGALALTFGLARSDDLTSFAFGLRGVY